MKKGMCKACSFKGTENEHVKLLLEDDALLRQHVDIYLEKEIGYVRPINMSKWIAHGLYMPSKNNSLNHRLKSELSHAIKKIIESLGWKYNKEFKAFRKRP